MKLLDIKWAKEYFGKISSKLITSFAEAHFETFFDLGLELIIKPGFSKILELDTRYQTRISIPGFLQSTQVTQIPGSIAQTHFESRFPF